jgi:hypothetical protein
VINIAIEYLYDAIRATASEEINISAVITDDEGLNITDNCYLALYDDETELIKVYGAFDGAEWTFTIPADVTEGLSGRYWYAIGRNNTNMCFKTPIYLM